MLALFDAHHLQDLDDQAHMMLGCSYDCPGQSFHRKMDNWII